MASASTVRSIASSCRRALAAGLLALAVTGAAAQPRTRVLPPLQTPAAPATAAPFVQAPAPTPIAPGQIGPAPLAPLQVHRMAAPGTGWNAVRGEANDLAISDSGEVFAAAKDGTLWQWIQGTTEWSPLPGSGVRLAAGPARILWTVERDGTLARYSGGRWLRLGVKARDVALDASGNALLALADGSVARLAAGSGVPEAIGGIDLAARIAAHSDGSTWIVREDQTLARHDGQAWRVLPGQASDIAIARSGAVLIASADGALQRWDAAGERWQAEPSVTGVAIVAAAPDGTPWVANAAGAMLTRAPVKPGALALEQAAQASAPGGIQFRRGGTRAAGGGVPFRTARAAVRGAATVTLKPPAAITDPAPIEWTDTLAIASDLAIGQDGSVFAIAVDGSLARWSNAQRRLLPFPGSFVQIAVEPGGAPWGINILGRIFRHTGSDWRQVFGTASDIAISANGSVMVAAANGALALFDRPNERFLPVAGELYFIALAPDGTPWGLLRDGTVLRCRAQPCDRVGLEARSLAIGPDGSVFIVNFTGELRRFNADSGQFEIIPVLGLPVKAVAVGPFGRPWVVTSSGRVLSSRFFNRDEAVDLQTAASTVSSTTGSGDSATVLGATSSGTSFTFSKNMKFNNYTVPSATTDDLAVGVDGTVIAVADSGTRLFRFDTSSKTFKELTNLPTGSVTAVDVDADGRLLLLDTFVDGRIYRQKQKNGTSYDTLTFPAGTGQVFFNRDLAIGPDGSIYAINTDGTVYRRTSTESSFTRLITGVWSRLAVGLSNDVWVLDLDGNLNQIVSGKLERRPSSGSASTTDVGGGPDGSIYAIQQYAGDASPTLYKWNANNRSFDRVNKAADHVDVAPNGRPWVTNTGSSGDLFQAR